jgi:predicted dehydrogenase
MPKDERVGFAIVGLGKLALENILPAFAESTRAKPVALVSGRPEKARIIAAQYGVSQQAIYDYTNFDKIRENPNIKAVYICCPTRFIMNTCCVPPRPESMCYVKSPWRLIRANARI